jgi:hypothetical protein
MQDAAVSAQFKEYKEFLAGLEYLPKPDQAARLSKYFDIPMDTAVQAVETLTTSPKQKAK